MGTSHGKTRAVGLESGQSSGSRHSREQFKAALLAATPAQRLIGAMIEFDLDARGAVERQRIERGAAHDALSHRYTRDIGEGSHGPFALDGRPLLPQCGR